MHENNFEKRVQEKMDQLGFDPSDTVWTAIDKEINKEKRSRKPFFFLFFLSGLLLAGGGIYFGMVKNSANNIITSQQLNGKKENKVVLPEGKIQNSSQQETGLTGRTTVENNQKTTLSKQSKGAIATKVNNPEKNIITIVSGKDFTEGKNQAISKNEPEKPGNTGVDSTAKKSKAAAENKMAKDSTSALKTASSEKKKAKPSLWKIGFTGGAGISNINQSLFKQSNVSGFYNNLANSITGNGAAAPVPVSSEPNPGFSFSAGAYISRYLSKRISISAGLNYHYYSTRVNTGYPVDSSIIVYSPAYYPANGTLPGAATYAVNGYYQNGSNYSYTNSYHFIELPLTADFQLNKNEKLPIFWEAGFSVSYLVNSNALHFDPNGNLYYQNAELFNKIQLNGATAFMIGFPVNKSELRLGPELQYGLTGLQKSGSGSPQHLFYTGLKISFIPGKK